MVSKHFSQIHGFLRVTRSRLSHIGQEVPEHYRTHDPE